MKKAFKAIITSILGWQIRRLRRRHPIRIVAVTGSIGKTSTKLAVANVLGESLKIRYQKGNYNHPLSVPLIFFGHSFPGLINPFAWLAIIVKNEIQLYRNYPYEIVVIELGTDGPGQIKDFGKYLHVDLLVVTAITPEHMEFFADLDAVAEEELSAQKFSKQLLVNKDLCPSKYMDQVTVNHLTYSIKQPADYKLEITNFSDGDYSFSISGPNEWKLNANYRGVAEIQLYSVCAAAVVAHEFGMNTDQIAAALSRLQAFSGRMQQLIGIRRSLIIDDTYNSSPVAVRAALDALYKLTAPQKIALLGNMNELGKYSEQAHREIGEYCDPQHLDMVVTIGPDANSYLAEAAEKRGCQVKRFNNPEEAGMFIKDFIQPNAAILAKGSQNGVYAEEAIKHFLADPQDAKLLVRQTPPWLSKKAKSFGR